MIYIIALVLAIPTYGLSIVAIIIYLVFLKYKSNRNIERAIIYLSSDSDSWGTCIEGISYVQAFLYAGTVGEIISRDDPLIKFKVLIKDKSFLVTLDKEPGGNNAIFISKNIDWINEAQNWISSHKISCTNDESGHSRTVDLLNTTRISVGAIGSQGATDMGFIPKEICELTNLCEIDFKSCNLKSLPREMGKLKNLKSLVIEWCLIESLPPQIGELTNLEVLKLSVNLFEDLPPEIWNLKQLKSLDLSANSIKQLPIELFKLSQLKKLKLSYLDLDKLPPEIGELTSLEVLDLTGNNLESLPPEIGKLTNLKTLDISKNKLKSLPPEIGELINLKNLDLSDNNLVELPPEIGNLDSLHSFNFDKDKILDKGF